MRSEELARQHATIWTPGATEATADKQSERISICGDCALMRNERCTVEPSCDIVLKAKAADTFCPAGKWHKQTEFYRPLVNPTRNLIWHIWPRLGKEWNWHRHIEKIKAAAQHFNGRIAIGINHGDNLAKVDDVKRLLDGVPVTDWVTAKAEPELGETTTFVDLLRCVETDDPNTVTFRGHCKGVSHRKTGIEQPWSDMMWATCMDLPSVDEALSSHIMAGPLKCQEPLVSHQRYRWFYAGTFFWFRNREIFQRDWSEFEQTRWYPEAWPGVLCRNEEAACLCHDFTDGSVLRENYWNMVVAPSFEQWKKVRPDRDRRFE